MYFFFLKDVLVWSSWSASEGAPARFVTRGCLGEVRSSFEAHLVQAGQDKTKTIHKLQDQINTLSASIKAKDTELEGKTNEISRLLKLESHFELTRAQALGEGGREEDDGPDRCSRAASEARRHDRGCLLGEHPTPCF